MIILALCGARWTRRKDDVFLWRIPAYLTQAAGGKKVTANDKKTLVARCGLPADGKVREAVAPQLSHYETEPLTAESPLRSSAIVTAGLRGRLLGRVCSPCPLDLPACSCSTGGTCLWLSTGSNSI